MSDCRANVLKLDEVFTLLKSGALSLGTGIASFDTEDNKLHLVTNDGRDLYFEFSLPNNGNRVVNMFLRQKTNELVIQQIVGGRMVEHKVPLPETKGIVDPIDATCTVGGVQRGTSFKRGYSLEKIVRQILSGDPPAPEVRLSVVHDRYKPDDKEVLLDLTVSELIELIDLIADVKIDDSYDRAELEDVWFSVVPDIDLHELISDVKGEIYRETGVDLSSHTLDVHPGRKYKIDAYAKDNFGHVGHDNIDVEWIYPQYVGIFDGKLSLSCLHNTKFLKEDAIIHPERYNQDTKFIPVEELTDEQRMELLDIESFDNTRSIIPGQEPDHDEVDELFFTEEYDNPDYDPVSDKNNDPVANPTYAIEPYYNPEDPDFNPDYDSSTPRTIGLLEHMVQRDNNMEYIVDKDIRGRVIIIYDFDLGLLRYINHNEKFLLNKYHYTSHVVELYDNRRYFVYISDEPYDFVSGDTITVVGK